MTMLIILWGYIVLVCLSPLVPQAQSVLALVVPITIPIVRPANTNLAIFWTCIFAFHAGALWITLFVLELKYIRYFIRIWLRFLNGTYTRRASFWLLRRAMCRRRRTQNGAIVPTLTYWVGALSCLKYTLFICESHISLFREERIGPHHSLLISYQSYPGEKIEHFKPHMWMTSSKSKPQISTNDIFFYSSWIYQQLLKLTCSWL